MDTVVIIGVGLIGGSFALALRATGFEGRLIGVGSGSNLAKAAELGVIDQGLSLEEALPQADLVYLSQPVLGIVSLLPRLGPLLKPGALVTDAGSTKAAIVEAAETHLGPGVFLGGHPMAGKEKSGVSEAEANLFENRMYALTPVRPDDLNHPVAVSLRSWIERIGSQILVLSPAEHDRIVAHTSHLGQLASTALAAALDRQFAGREGGLRLAGPGLVDMTRLALSPYEIWEGILKTNTGPIEQALEALIQELQALRSDLAGEGPRTSFAKANTLANRIRS